MFFSVHRGVDGKGRLEHMEGVYGEREVRGKEVPEPTVSPLSNAIPLYVSKPEDSWKIKNNNQQQQQKN